MLWQRGKACSQDLSESLRCHLRLHLNRVSDAHRHAGDGRRFVPIGFARSAAGGYTFSIFPVVAIAPIASWSSPIGPKGLFRGPRFGQRNRRNNERPVNASW